MARRAQMVQMTVSIQLKAMIYIDEYARKNRLSRSASVDELLRLARAYLKVLDAQDTQKDEEELEKPSILLRREQKSMLTADEFFKKHGYDKKPENESQKRTKKAKTPSG